MLKIHHDSFEVGKVHVFNGEVIFVCCSISIICDGFGPIGAQDVARHIAFR